MIASLLDRIACWWLDRRTAPQPPGVPLRFLGDPLDGTTATDHTGTPTHRVIHTDPTNGRHHIYRADGTCDADGARRLCYDPQEGQ